MNRLKVQCVGFRRIRGQEQNIIISGGKNTDVQVEKYTLLSAISVQS